MEVEEKLTRILQKHWGFPSFRSGQLEIIEAIVSGRDVLAILTTGGGKSICYQVAGLYLGGTTIVISPLIALMQDQVDSLKKKGIAAEFLNSSQTKSKRKVVISKLEKMELDFFYIAPETLANKSLKKVLKNVEVNLVAVDEAHCISVWGQDFRPAYTLIRENLEEIFSQASQFPILTAFTATATPRTRRDISRQLALRNPRRFLNSFYKANLTIKVKKKLSEENLLELISTRLKLGAVLIYAASQNRCEKLSGELGAAGVESAYYHGGMDKTARNNVQNRYIDGEINVIVATNAFGMGVDKGDIYTVIHDAVPDSLENYFQEAGRAGRDGTDSLSVINFDWRGINLRKQMNENSYLSPQIANNVYNYLRKLQKVKMEFEIEQALLDIENINRSQLELALSEFHHKKLVYFDVNHPEQTRLLKSNVLFLCTKINFSKNLKLYRKGKYKLFSMVDMCAQKKCRMQYILNYFGEASETCGNCDICELESRNGSGFRKDKTNNMGLVQYLK
ncbi:MAG: RecQ family ATP-dependent DNA helicase [Candidatus Dojkabacteria bacterium]